MAYFAFPNANEFKTTNNMYYKPSFILMGIEMNKLGSSPKKDVIMEKLTDLSLQQFSAVSKLLWYKSLS